eukprot:365811-Chlamydomonas_euryale.AAC.35
MPPPPRRTSIQQAIKRRQHHQILSVQATAQASMASAACIDLPDGWLSDGAASTEPCGLFVTDGGSLSDAPGDGSSVKAIALRSRHVHASVFAEHGFAEVTERLEYLCDQDCTARFVFPLPPRSAVYR